MERAVEIAGSLAMIAILPIVVIGTINRVKARWAGRRGAPILQLAFDLRRLSRKATVVGEPTSPIIRIAPIVVLVSTLASACIVPVLGTHPLVSFDYDFVLFAYLWGLGRVAMMLGALDTGSSFEGMGAAREATFSTLVEPIVFLVAGALCLQAGSHSLGAALVPHLAGTGVVTWVASIVALIVVVQVESSRMPIDDPTTHLELTMIHEVMILDHGARELAMLQLAGALKLFVGLSLVATLLNPFAGVAGLATVGVQLGIVFVLALAVAMSESLVARIKMRVVPQYVIFGLVAAGIALVAMIGKDVAR